MASLRIANDLKNLIKRMIYDECYPVGSIYISMNSTSPATRFGGTWVQITDKFLYCTKSSKTTGGSTTTGGHTLTINEIPSHNHKNWIVTQALWSYSNQYGQYGNIGRASDTGNREEKDNYSWNEATGGGVSYPSSKSSSIYYLLRLVQNSLKKAGVIYE